MTAPTFLGFGAREGYIFGFEIEEDCRRNGIELKCGATFDGSGHATQLGPYERGAFEPNADIAGRGVLVGLVPCAIIAFIAIIVGPYRAFRTRRPPPHRVAKEIAEGTYSNRAGYMFLFGVADFSLIFGLAYILSFLLSSKCTLSVYHYYIVLDTTLIALSTILLATQMAHRSYWRSWAGAIRFIFTLALLVLLGILLCYQAAMPYFPEWLPEDTSTRNDSAILLPASCFLDPDLSDRDSPFSNGTGAIKDEAQLERLGGTGKPREMAEFVLYIFLFLSAICTYLDTLFHACCGPRRDFIKGKPSTKSALSVVFWFFISVPCLVTDIVCAYHIFNLRSWVHSSGWMDVEPFNPENNLSELSQLLPIFGILALVLLLVEPAKCCCGKRANKRGTV